MIRILHCISGMNRGGAETFIMNLYRNIDRSKIQFDFLVSTNKECAYDKEILKLGGEIYYTPGRREGIFKRNKELIKFFSKNKGKYKAIHVHVSSLSDISALKFATQYDILIRIIHSHNIREGGSFIHKYLHKFHKLYIDKYVTDVFACSVDAAKWLCSKKRFNKNSYSVINNAIDIQKFKFNKHIRQEKRKELGLEDKLVIGHTGRFADQKNHEFLIDIFKAVYDKNKNAMLLLIGDGPLRNKIELKVKSLDLDKNVIFAGLCPNVNELLSAMDVFLFPSKYEGLGIVLVEAQANGLVCIASDVIPKETNLTNQIDYVSLNKGPQHWANIIIEKSKKQRENTLDNISKLGFDIKQVTAELEKIYIR